LRPSPGEKARYSSDGLDARRMESDDMDDDIDGALDAVLLDSDDSYDGESDDSADDSPYDDASSASGSNAPPPYEGPYTLLRLVVSEGKHRMVRRMLFNAGYPVAELRRERHGRVTLGDLDVGRFRELNGEEESWAMNLLEKTQKGKPKKKKNKRKAEKEGESFNQRAKKEEEKLQREYEREMGVEREEAPSAREVDEEEKRRDVRMALASAKAALEEPAGGRGGRRKGRPGPVRPRKR